MLESVPKKTYCLNSTIMRRVFCYIVFIMFVFSCQKESEVILKEIQHVEKIQRITVSDIDKLSNELDGYYSSRLSKELQSDLKRVSLGKGKTSMFSENFSLTDFANVSNNNSNVYQNNPPIDNDFFVDVYKVNYNTSVGGQIINTSGIVIIPVFRNPFNPLRILSFQNGTNTEYSLAPSKVFVNGNFLSMAFNPDKVLFAEAIIMAKLGFAFFMPDYIGFGDSEGDAHPYYVKNALVDNTINNYYASKALLDKLRVRYKKDILLAGYSQGAWVTMATLEAIKRNYRDIKVRAVSVGGGPYDALSFADRLLEQDVYERPFYFPYAYLGYLDYGFIDDGLSGLFNAPYDAIVRDNLFDGVRSATEVDDLLNMNVDEFFTPDFVSNFNSSPQFSVLRELLRENSVDAWTGERTDMYIFHGTHDNWVFPSLSKELYRDFVNKGKRNIRYFPIYGGDHITAGIAWLLSTKTGFYYHYR